MVGAGLSLFTALASFLLIGLLLVSAFVAFMGGIGYLTLGRGGLNGHMLRGMVNLCGAWKILVWLWLISKLPDGVMNKIMDLLLIICHNILRATSEGLWFYLGRETRTTVKRLKNCFLLY